MNPVPSDLAKAMQIQANELDLHVNGRDVLEKMTIIEAVKLMRQSAALLAAWPSSAKNEPTQAEVTEDMLNAANEAYKKFLALGPHSAMGMAIQAALEQVRP